jgi:hypothetical protein
MTQHVADRILAALEAQLATVASVVTVSLQPLHALGEASLPAIIVDEIEDEVESRDGFFPVIEKHRLRFTVFPCLMASSSSFKSAVGQLHHDAEKALVGTVAARTLGGLLTMGLQRGNAVYSVDSESLQKPVGGWRIPFECTYYLRSDEPGKVEKE